MKYIEHMTAPRFAWVERGDVTTVLHGQGKDTKILSNPTLKGEF